MTKAQALHDFFSGFGMTAYPSTSVPDDVIFPYLTYDVITSSWGASPVSPTVNLWFYTDSEAVPNAKAEEISKAIGFGGTTLKCDDGLIWIRKGSPFCQSLVDDTDRNIKRRYINLMIEFMTY